MINSNGFIFYTGSMSPTWLGKLKIPLFQSRSMLHKRRTFIRAVWLWSLDSQAFTILNKHGYYPEPQEKYASEINLYQSEIGMLNWAAPQDWMCEPFVLKKTGLSINEHQIRTIRSVLFLRDTVKNTHIIPVLQGWQLDDYLRHIDSYFDNGINLFSEPLVGLGSVCRRQNTNEAISIVNKLADLGISLHLFGFKISGLSKVSHRVKSSDSMAWSYSARRDCLMPQCAGGDHANCASCHHYALHWRKKLLEMLHKDTNISDKMNLQETYANQNY
jgi:hypothetical protein